MDFSLLGHTLEISDGRKNYMKIITDYKNMAEQAEKDFKQEYENIFGTVFLNSTYAERFKKTYCSGDYMDGIVKQYVAKTRQYLASYGIYSLSDAAIWNDAIIAEDRSVSRLQYEFNIFMIECIRLDEDDDSFISRLKSRFSGSYFPTCLRNDVMALCDFVLNYLNDNGIAEIQFVYKKDSSEAEAIFKNLLDANVPAAEQERLAYSLIELDPRKKSYYEYIFCKLPQAKYEIAIIAQYLSIDLSDLIEKDIKRDFNLKSISCEEEALKMMSDLHDTMKKFGISTSSRQTELKKILHDFDVEARTYDSVLYDTRALCAQAELDDRTLYNLHGDIESANKNTCSNFLTKIVHMQCTPAIKNKHLQLLNDRIVRIDNEHLEQLVTGAEHRDENECNQIKERINQYDASQETKAPYLSRIDKRIYSIWDAEDFERFAEIYIHTSVSSAEQIGENCSLIQSTGRTESKELFVKALYLLNETEVEAAAKYAIAKENGLFASLINMGKKESYEILTLSGRVIHPAILCTMETLKAKKSHGILSGFGLKKNKPAPQVTQLPISVSDNAKFCSTCGAKVDYESKFCANCGNKLN